MERNATVVLSRKVRSLMRQRGWTLVELAKRSDVSKSAIGNLLNYRDQNDSHPSTRTIEQLGAAFGMPAWKMLMPDDVVAEPEPLDTELLALVLAESVDLFHGLGVLPNFEELAAVAVRMYNEVKTGIPMRRARESVNLHLEQIKNGTFLASRNKSLGEDSKRGRRNQGAPRGGKGRTR